MVIVGVVIVIVTIIKATKKKSKNTPSVTPAPPTTGLCCARCGRPMPVGTVFCTACGASVAPSAPTQEDRDKAEIAALSLEEVHRRYCDVAGRSDEYRYLCYEELERRKGKQ